MTLPFCPQERKIARLLREHRWPHDAGPALRRHAERCGRCAGTLLAVEALSRARTMDMGRIPPVSAEHLWWRGQLLRRAAAAERAARPLAWAEGLALAAALALAAGLGVGQRATFVELCGTFAGMAILAGLGLVLCVGGLTFYLSERRG